MNIYNLLAEPLLELLDSTKEEIKLETMKFIFNNPMALHTLKKYVKENFDETYSDDKSMFDKVEEPNIMPENSVF